MKHSKYLSQELFKKRSIGHEHDTEYDIEKQGKNWSSGGSIISTIH